MDSNERNKSIEVLRIVAMFMVIVHHVLLHGGILKSSEILSFRGVIASILDGICQNCVNIFFLISGYFFSTTQCTFYRNIKLYFRVLYFSIVCMMFNLIFVGGHIQLSSILYSIMPITSNQWWFITKYSVLILVAPILNVAWDKMKENRIKFILAWLLCFCILPTFIPWSRDIFGRGYEFTWCFLLFYIGRFVAEEERIKRITAKKCFIVFIITALATGFSRPAIAFVEKITIGRYYGTDMLFTYNNIIVFISSICLFLYFIKINIKSKYVFKMGEYCIGAYLISDMAIWREAFWEFFPVSKMSTISIIGLVCGIMMVGILLDWVRSKLFYYIGIISLEKRISCYLDKKFSSLIQFCAKRT